MSDVIPIPIGTQAIDTDSVITPSVAAELRDLGVTGVFRYVSRAFPQHPGDLSVSEVAVLHGAGLAVLAIQHVPPPRRWMPSAILGRVYGLAAVANARSCGLPPGVSIVVDIESPAPQATPDDIFSFENSWTGCVRAAGYRSVVYLAESLPESLTSEDLFFRIRSDRYWRSASRVPEIFNRGYCVKQSLPRKMAGIMVDQNVVCGDAFGGVPFWYAP